MLKNPLRKPIFPMEKDRYIQANGILHFELGPTCESVLLADEGVKQVTRLHELLVPLIVPLGHFEPGWNFL